MKVFFTTVGGGCSLVAALILWADPGHMWHRVSRFPDQEITPGSVWVIPKVGVNERDMRLAQMKWIPQPDLLLMGSSRIVPVHSRMFRDGLKIYNSGTGGACVEDYAIYWQCLKDFGKIPKRLIIFLDPWSLNQGNNQPNWRENFAYLNEFQPGLYPHPWRQKTWYALTHLNEFLSLSLVAVSLDYLRHGWQEEKKNGRRLIPESDLPPGASGLHWDGRDYSLPVGENALPEGELRKRILIWFRSGFVPLAHWKLDAKAFSLLDAVLEDMTRHQVRVMIVLPPFNPLALELLKGEEPKVEGLQTIQESTAAIASLKRSIPELSICNAIDSSRFQCTAADFSDGYHFNGRCAKKVLAGCFAADPDWKMLPLAPG